MYFTTRYFQFLDGIFCWYLYTQFVSSTFNDELTYRNTSSENLSLVIYGSSMCLSIIKLLMDLQTIKVRQENKNFFALIRQYFHR
jgi:hypothetical protein